MAQVATNATRGHRHTDLVMERFAAALQLTRFHRLGAKHTAEGTLLVAAPAVAEALLLT